MKALGLALLGCALVGCSSVVQLGQLERSLDTWRTLKAENGGHYQYESYSSSWTGASSTTTFEVREDVVITRTYEASNADGSSTESWTETGAEVGSHEGGEPPRTVEEVYGVCRDEVLTKDTLRHNIYLDFQENGLLASCVYAEKGCADDCSRGVDIQNLRFLSE